MESNKIHDSQITASSYKTYYEPRQARLHMTASASGNGAWCASQSHQRGEWLQVSARSLFVFLCTHWRGGGGRGGKGNNLIKLMDSLPLVFFFHLDSERVDFFGTLVFSVLKVMWIALTNDQRTYNSQLSKKSLLVYLLHYILNILYDHRNGYNISNINFNSRQNCF